MEGCRQIPRRRGFPVRAVTAARGGNIAAHKQQLQDLTTASYEGWTPCSDGHIHDAAPGPAARRPAACP